MSVPSRPQRPRTVTLLILGVFLLGIWNAGRTLAIAKQSDLLLTLTVTPDPRIRIGMAAVWTVIFFGAAAALWWKRPFSPTVTPILLSLYAIIELMQKLFFTQDSINWELWWITAVIYALAIITTYWILNRSAAKLFFGKKQEPKRDNPNAREEENESKI